MDSVKTICPYCGVGCGLEIFGAADKRRVRGDRDHPSSQGMVCVKGATILESLERDRLTHPMMRSSLTEPFQRISWDQALDAIAARIRALLATQGADSICMYGSGQFLTEDYYVAQKLIKGCLGTNNFDANSRLCMSSAVSGYIRSFGADGPPACYDDLEQTNYLFAIGTNTADCHPIAFNRFRKYHKAQGDRVKLVVADPRRTATAEVADLHLAIRPGSDIDLVHGIAHLLWQWGAIAKDFIVEHTEGFEAYLTLLKDYTPDRVADRCAIDRADLETAARWWTESERVLSIWSMGINQSAEGTAKVRSIIDLHLLTGQIGRPGTGPFSLTGQPNAMGGREAGGLAKLLPGYRLVSHAADRAAVEQFWQVPAGRISPREGRDAWGIIEGLETGDVGLLWIAATNPAVSFPDLNRTKAALQKSPFTVYQDAYYPTETTAYAHLLLPAAQWSEKTGTMTNSERVVTLAQGFREPPGEARADWEIFAEVGRRLGFGAQFQFQDAAAVHREFVQLTADRPCDMSGMDHEQLAQGPLQWPCPRDRPDYKNFTKRLYENGQFQTPSGRARFSACDTVGLAEPPDEDYPLILTVGRLYGHWHTQTRTGRIEKIRKMHPEPFLEIHPIDALPLGLVDGGPVVVRSRRGVAQFPARVTTAIAPGTVFAPMHWGLLWADGAEANGLTHPARCPDSLQPELKACAVRVERLPEPMAMESALGLE
jgi:ferredoxin-nitrate reductase